VIAVTNQKGNAPEEELRKIKKEALEELYSPYLI